VILGRVAHLDHFAESADRIFTLGISHQLTGYRNRPEQLALLARDFSSSHRNTTIDFANEVGEGTLS